MTTIFALDPGSALVGVAVLRMIGGRPTFIAGGHRELGDLGALIGNGAEHVILETLEGYAYSLARVKDMVLTARMEGRIIGLAKAAGIEPMTISAGAARGEVCRSSNASNAQIAIVVEALVDGAPSTLKKVERQHVYDACLYGLAGLQRLLGRAFPLPPDAELALHVLREQERAKSSAKGRATKAARQMGARS